MSGTEFDAVVAGHICLDVIPRFPDTGARTVGEIMAPGKLVNVGEAAVSTGGSVSNTGLALIKLGMRTLLMGKIGDDFFGAGVHARLREWGEHVDQAMTVVPGEQTSYSLVMAPHGIDRIFLHNPGANDTFSSRDINYDLVGKARLFHLGYPPLMRNLYLKNGRELIKIYSRVKRLGVTTSLDMSLPDDASESGGVDWRRLLAGLLPCVDIAPFSAEEAMYMLNRPRFEVLKRRAGNADALQIYETSDFEWLGRELLRLGAAIVPLKCGYRGVLLFTRSANRIATLGAATPPDPAQWGNRQLWEESFSVDKVASATGSGDSSIAGFLAAFLRGCGPEESLATACCCGAQNVKVLDAVSGIATWEETQAMIPAWSKNRQSGGPGWSYDPVQRVWRHGSDGKREGDESRSGTVRRTGPRGKAGRAAVADANSWSPGERCAYEAI
jgi:sugar/nucleoside kinase (ribokinase family)